MPERTTTVLVQGQAREQDDVLLVVDDTAGIAPSLPALRAAYPGLAQVFESLPGGLPWVHLRAVSGTLTESGGASASDIAASCNLPAPESGFLTAGACDRQANFPGEFADAFACLADRGANSAGPFQPFEALRRTLTSDAPDGFRRPSVSLLILIIAGSDDASQVNGELVPAATYVDFVRALKPEYQVLVSVIGPSSSCGDGSDVASVAPRLRAMVDAFRGSYVPLCSADFRAALTQIATRVGIGHGPPCIVARDVDPDRAGLQVDCAVEEQIPQPDGTVQRTALPNCDQAAPPCWRIDPASAVCRGGQHPIIIERPTDWCAALPPSDTVTCLACADPADPACAGP